MSRSSKKIYRRRRPVRTILIVLGCLVFAALLLFLMFFHGFKKYAVYTDDGVTLEIPWLEGYRNTDSIDIIM